MTNLMAVDTECGGLSWVEQDQRPFLVSWYGESGAGVSHPSQEKVLENTDDVTQFVFHNAPFDLLQLSTTDSTIGGLARNVLSDLTTVTVHDTGIMAKLLYPVFKPTAGAFGLKPLAADHLGIQSVKEEWDLKEAFKRHKIATTKIGSYFELWLREPELVEAYALQDAKITYELAELFLEQLETRELLDVYECEREVQLEMARVSHRGVPLDKYQMCLLCRKYRQKMSEIEEVLRPTFGDLEGTGSQERFVRGLKKNGVVLTKKTEKGKWACDEATLREYAEGNTIVQDILTFRHMKKFLTTYIEPHIHKDRLNGGYNSYGAYTGRMSSSNPNMQTLPKRSEEGNDIRKAIVPGRTASNEPQAFCVADYDAIEVRILAHYLRNEEFTSLLESGHDPHAWLASKIWGGETADYASGSDKEKLRSRAKNTLFAIIYGAGIAKIAGMNDISPEEAKPLINGVRKALGTYSTLVGNIESRLKDRGYITTLGGRQLNVPVSHSYIGINALIQGSAADVIKRAIYNYRLTDYVESAPIVMVVHDEIVVASTVKNAEGALQNLKRVMEDAIPLRPRLVASGDIRRRNYGTEGTE